MKYLLLKKPNCKKTILFVGRENSKKLKMLFKENYKVLKILPPLQETELKNISL